MINGVGSSSIRESLHWTFWLSVTLLAVELLFVVCVEGARVHVRSVLQPPYVRNALDWLSQDGDTFEIREGDIRFPPLRRAIDQSAVLVTISPLPGFYPALVSFIGIAAYGRVADSAVPMVAIQLDARQPMPTVNLQLPSGTWVPIDRNALKEKIAKSSPLFLPRLALIVFIGIFIHGLLLYGPVRWARERISAFRVCGPAHKSVL